MGDIGTTYNGRFVIDSVKGGKVVATHDNAFGTTNAIFGETFIGGQDFLTGATSNAHVQINADDNNDNVADFANSTIAENFILEARTTENGAVHLVNASGDNTLTGFISVQGTDANGTNAYITSAAGLLTLTNEISASSIAENLGLKNLLIGGAGNIQLDGATAVNGIRKSAFGDWASITKQGTGTMTNSSLLNDYTGSTTVAGGTYNMAGTHTTGSDYIVGPSAHAALTLNGGTIIGSGNLIIGDGTVVVGSASTLTVTETVNNVGPGLLNVNTGGTVVTNNVRADSFTLDGTTTVRTNGGTAGASKVETLTIGGSGKLNLTDNDLVVGTAANVDAVRTAIVAGKVNNAATGITSDVAAFGTTTGFGYALGSDAALSPLLAGSLSGQSYDSDSVLVKYTFLGDADLDGDSDLNDLGLWAQSFTGDLGNPANPATYWTSGDFDYDGDTDLNDLGFWAGTFTGDLGGGAGSLIVVAPGAPAGAVAALNSMGITVVPEPSTFVLASVGLAGLAIAARRKRDA